MTAPNAQTEANTLLVLRHPKGSLPLTFGAKGTGADLAAIARWLEGVAGGFAAGENAVDVHRGSTDAAPYAARAVAVMATSSGTVGVVLNGVTLTVAWGTSDVVTQTALAAAIRASVSAVVAGLVGASNLGATASLVSSVAGDWVEIQPIGGAPVRFTAIASDGVGGPGAQGTFKVGGTDTAAAAALVAAVKKHPLFKDRLYVANAAGVVTFLQMENSTTVKYRIQKSGAPITLSAAGNFAAQASCLIWALQKGKIGNCMTIAASGTNVSILNTLTRLFEGVGGDPAAGPSVFLR